MIRAAGTQFFDRSRGWLSWPHVKVLTAARDTEETHRGAGLSRKV